MAGSLGRQALAELIGTALRYLDWDLPDPARKSVDEVRPICDEIDRRVHALLDELVPAAP